MKAIIQTLWPEFKKYKSRIIVALLLGLVISGAKFYNAPLIKNLEQVWSSNDNIKIYQIPILIAALWVVAAIARYFHMYLMILTAEEVALNLRRQLMHKYLSLNLSFFQNFVRGSGGLISRLLNDIYIVQTGFRRLADVIREPFLTILSFGYLVYIDWKLTLFLILALPIISTVSRRMARSIRKYSARNQEAMEDITQTIKESLDGTRIVQAFNLQPELKNRFEREADNYIQSREKIISREESTGPISESLVAVLIAGVLIYIGFRIRSGAWIVGDFLSFFAAAIFLSDSVKKIQDSYIKIQQASVALERLRDILDSTDEIHDPESPEKFPEDWKEIEFKNVSFSYENKKVLNGVNLTISRGEKVALVGTSGAGKSTMINLLPRFFDPTDGEIRIGGVPLNHLKVNELRSHVALVTQDVFLFSDSVSRNIQSGDFSKDDSSVESAAKLANAHDFISKNEQGYEARVGDRGSLFSGGEKQRISIARAIFKDAPILILDEATSALDSQSEVEVQRGLDQLMKGRTALIIAHRLSTIRDCDRIVVMDKGQIVEMGTHQELMDKKGGYFQFIELQSHL
ncbi:MAG: ABC transporter [Bdellovibrionaceae bacterium]|nr:ABC transporter [Pseudobdellovibrionaceae bacterium]